MAERKENEKTSEPKEGELRQASSKTETPAIPPEDRAKYWREQDPKCCN